MNNSIDNLIDNLALLNEEDEMNDWEQQKYVIENQYNSNPNNIALAPTKLFISTLSANCRTIPIDCEYVHINIQLLITYLEKNPFKELIYFKNSKNTSRKNQINGSGNCIFYNQVTLNINPYYDPNKYINKITSIKIKLFQNGIIGICGMKDIYYNDGYLAINILLNYIKNLPENVYNIDNNILNIYNFKYTFTNSDFGFTSPFFIDRNKLYNLLLTDNYFVIYKNDTYQAVKLRYYYNESYIDNIGICKCNIKCAGKGDGLSNGNCKCITIPIFQSGRILINGKCEIKHITHAYNFITQYLISHHSHIKQISSGLYKLKTEKIKLEINHQMLTKILQFKNNIK